MNVYLPGAPNRLYKKVSQNPRMRGDGGLAWHREASWLCTITIRPPLVAQWVFGPAWFLHMLYVIGMVNQWPLSQNKKQKNGSRVLKIRMNKKRWTIFLHQTPLQISIQYCMYEYVSMLYYRLHAKQL